MGRTRDDSSESGKPRAAVAPDYTGSQSTKTFLQLSLRSPHRVGFSIEIAFGPLFRPLLGCASVCDHSTKPRRCFRSASGWYFLSSGWRRVGSPRFPKLERETAQPNLWCRGSIHNGRITKGESGRANHNRRIPAGESRPADVAAAGS